MALIPTKQLFDEFFADMDENSLKKIKPQADRPELYAYEKKIGKQFIDMNADELIDMVNTFEHNGFPISYATYDSLSVLYRKIFEYYIDHYELIRNPFNAKTMRGVEAYKRLKSVRKTITKQDLEDVISQIYKTNSEDRATYITSILLLYYNGFKNAEEIVSFKEKDIDFEAKTVSLGGRIAKLDDRCFDLMVRVHNMEKMIGWRGDFVMMPWRDSYFKFSIRPAEVAVFDKRDLNDACNLINRVISERVRRGLGCDLDGRALYFLGFYDWLVEQYGEEKANYMILSKRDHDAIEDLKASAKMYGIDMMVYPLKKIMFSYAS